MEKNYLKEREKNYRNQKIKIKKNKKYLSVDFYLTLILCKTKYYHVY